MKRTLSMQESGPRELAAALLGEGVRVVAPTRAGPATGEQVDVRVLGEDARLVAPAGAPTATTQQVEVGGLAEDARVLAPVRSRSAAADHVELRALGDASEMVLDAPLPRRPLKELFLPPTEVLLRWRKHGQEVEIEATRVDSRPTVVLGARPCDAAALEKIDRVMAWDYQDELWQGRRRATTIVGVACPGEDGSCFCTAVGLAPDSTRGSDLFLTQAAGGFRVDVVTDKGTALVEAHPKLFGAEVLEPRGSARGRVAENLAIDAARVRDWIEAHFDDPFWKRAAPGCHGCGVCAFVCPCCHCFDIVDEPEDHLTGARRRNWDTCQSARFTVHASGHNPRPDQCARCRQRISHKLAIYPQRFGEILCTGCGRCVRACPAGVDILEVLAAIDRMAREAGGGP